MTVSTAQAGPLIWKSHFATRPARRRTPGSRGPALSLRPRRRSGHRRTATAPRAAPGWAGDVRRRAGRSGEAPATRAPAGLAKSSLSGQGGSRGWGGGH